jgi:transcriptional regulator with XRE-family HTH domain
MRRTKQTTVLALTGAVALASGAYALGSQAGDGSADAAKANGARQGYGVRPFGGPPGRWRAAPPSLQGLADRLGVKEADLRAALADIRKSLPAPQERRDDFAQGLADALGIDVTKVTAALDKLHPRDEKREHGDFAAALAKQLGLSAAKVQKALEQQRGRGPGGLADALGVTPQKLRQALAKLWRDRPHRDGPGRPGADAAALAKELGVTEAKLKAAFDKVRAAHEADETKLRDQFAQQLADRLHLDVQKVKDALGDFGRGFGGHHP